MTVTDLDQNTGVFNVEFKHRAAVFITGMTPAVVTETLCMLLRGECHSHLTSGKKHRFVPTEIHIITTRGDDINGANAFITKWKNAGLEAVLNCLKEYGVNKRHEITIDLWFITSGADVKECWADSATGKLACGSSKIKLADWKGLKIRAYNAALPGKGDEVSDIRTEAENSIAGDYVARVLRGLTHGSDAGNRAIHASMAGGRKTMSGYMKGAMWLLGRAQDRLSHVLVDSDLEVDDWRLKPIVGETAGRANTKDNYLLQGEQNEITHSGSASHQAITLTDVPFVRLGALLALSPSQSKLSYSELVTWAETRLKNAGNTISMTLDCKTQTIDLNGQVVELTGQRFFLLLLLAAQKKHKNADGWIRVGFLSMEIAEVKRFEAAWSKAEDNGLHVTRSGSSSKHKSGEKVADSEKPAYWSTTVSPLMTNINKDKVISAVVAHTPNAGDGLVVSRDTGEIGESDGPAQKAFMISARVSVEIRNFGGSTEDLVIVDNGFKHIPT